MNQSGSDVAGKISCRFRRNINGPLKCERTLTANVTHQRESLHVSLDDFRMRTLEFLDDLEALVELRKHVRDGAGEQRVLRRLLELHANEGHGH